MARAARVLLLVLIQLVALSAGAPSASAVVGDHGHTGSAASNQPDPTEDPCTSTAGAAAHAWPLAATPPTALNLLGSIAAADAKASSYPYDSVGYDYDDAADITNALFADARPWTGPGGDRLGAIRQVVWSLSGPAGFSAAPNGVAGLGDEAFQFATRAEKLDHIFVPKHNLDPLISQLGSREAVVQQMLNGVSGRTPAAGVFELTTDIAGQQVVVRGAVVDGVVKLGTAFTP